MTWAEYVTVNGREYRCFCAAVVSAFRTREPDGAYAIGPGNKVYGDGRFADPTPEKVREMEIAVVADAYGVTADEVRGSLVLVVL